MGRRWPSTSPSSAPASSAPLDTAGGHLEAGARKVVISAPGKGVDATIVMGINDDDVRRRTPRRGLQRLLHHQLRGPDGQGAARRVRRPAGLHEHRPRLHRGPEPARRSPQGPAPGALGGGEHHPDHHRRGPRGRPGPARAGRAARRRRPAGAGGRRLARRPRRAPGPRRHRGRGERRLRGRQPRARSWAGGCATRTSRSSRRTSSATPASCVFDSSLTQASGRFVKVFGWYDNEWGYVSRLVELVRLVGAGGRSATDENGSSRSQ